MSIKRMNRIMILSQGNEAFADGQKRRELEYTFYGKLDDFSLLEAAAKKEDQEQWNIPLESENVYMRLRRIGAAQYVQTVKIRREGVKGKDEVESEISEDMYNALKETATSGYRKTRYYFEVEGSDLVWEIDVFEDLAGQKHPWIKLDLEVPTEETQLPDLPFAMNEKIVAQGDHKSDEENAFLDKLWNTEWNIKLDKPTVIQEAPESPVKPEEEEAAPGEQEEEEEE